MSYQELSKWKLCEMLSFTIQRQMNGFCSLINIHDFQSRLIPYMLSHLNIKSKRQITSSLRLTTQAHLPDITRTTDELTFHGRTNWTLWTGRPYFKRICFIRSNVIRKNTLCDQPSILHAMTYDYLYISPTFSKKSLQHCVVLYKLLFWQWSYQCDPIQNPPAGILAFHEH